MHYAYGKDGRLQTVQTKKGEESLTDAAFAYGALGELTGVLDFGGQLELVSDLENRTLTTVDARGETIIHTYDEDGNRTLLQYPNGETAVYAYDALGRLQSLTSGGESIAYRYDPKSRLSRKIYGNGLVRLHLRRHRKAHRCGKGRAKPPLLHLRRRIRYNKFRKFI